MEIEDDEVPAPQAGAMRPEDDGAKKILARKPPVWPTPEAWAEGERTYHAGASAAEVAAKLGVSRSAFYNRMAGLKGKRALRRARWEAAQGGFALAGDPPPKELVACNWPAIAHKAQLPPDGAWSTWLFLGGRGAGKTRAGAEWLAARAEATPHGRFALVAPTQHDLREVMIEGHSGIRNLPGREIPKYDITRRLLTWTNGATAYGFSAQEPDRLRGPQFMAAWADEFCAWEQAEQVLMNLRMGLRLGDDPRLVVTTTPKPIDSLRLMMAERSCVITQAGSAANAHNLAEGFVERLMDIYAGTPWAEQELEGKLVKGSSLLWSADLIRDAQAPSPGMFDRIVVAVDPPAGGAAGNTSGRGSACGIVVAGRLGDVAYVLADRSVVGLPPAGWARRAVEAAVEFGASLIVAESNQGGDMVLSTLTAEGPPCRLAPVRAIHGKRVRAEPVSIMYRRGVVKHCAPMEQLEAELRLMGASERETGLDRADALVWAITELLRDRMQVPKPTPRILMM